MIYRQVKIEVDRKNKKWLASVNEIPMDREYVQVTVPHPLGWFNYPETMSDGMAFRKLKQCMIKRHKQEIADLQKSLKALQSLLLYPEKVKGV